MERRLMKFTQSLAAITNLQSTFVTVVTLILAGCGGGESSVVGSGSTVFGVAATGLAINGSVILKDSAGTTRTASISQPSGTFSIDVTGLNPPYFLKATDTAGTTTLYSLATGPGNFNINPISNLVVVAAAMNIDPLAKTPDVAFSNPANFASLTSTQVQAATTSVMAQMSPAFQAALSTNGATNFNPLTGSFQVGQGLDKVFDSYAITLNASTGVVQELQVSSNTTTTLGLVDKLGIFSAAGIYNGTVDTPVANGIHHTVSDIVITASGEMRYVMDNGVQVIANLTMSGSVVYGTGKAFAPTLNGQPTSFQFVDGSKSVNLTMKGTSGAGTIAGTLEYGNSTDAFSFTLNPQQTKTTSSLSKIAGTYASSTDSNTGFIGHIEANGNIWGSGPRITYSGLIQIIDPSTGVYRVTLAYVNNGTYGFDTGLATFYEASPTSDLLLMPTALVPDGYTGEVSNLDYSQSVAGGHAKFYLQLSSPLNQIVLSAVRLSTLPQTIAVKPTAATLVVQAIGSPVFSITGTGVGSLQYSSSSPTINLDNGLIIDKWESVSILSNPGRFSFDGSTIDIGSITGGGSIGLTGAGGSITGGGSIGLTGAGGSITVGGSFGLTGSGGSITGGNTISIGG
jgi:hypothetical protein